MCVVSLVTQEWFDPLGPNRISWTPTTPDPATAQQMLDVIQRLEALDKKLGAIDCRLQEAEKQKIKAKLRRRAKRK